MKNVRKLSTILGLSLLFIGCSLNDQSNYLSFESGILEDQELPFQENYKDHGENPFINTSDAPISTFSVDADGASYANMRRFLNLGQTPPEAAVRIEEFINYFTFDYAEPNNNHHVALNSEVAVCPWNTEHYLMRIGMKGKTIPENELPNSNYVFLIDVSGSMSSPDKLGVLKSGFKTLTDNLRNEDKIAIVTYAGNAGLLLPSTPGSEKDKIKEAIDKLGAGGSTAGAEGIITAYNIAKDNFIEQGNNRVILGSDGDFNVGPSSTEDLVKLIEEQRETGIYLTVLGVGGGNLNDNAMEQIANKGNGNYEYIDNAKQIEKVFTHELGKLYTVAKDSKIQITFNSNKVTSYRLIGYENRALENEDFEDDTKDAGEIGSSQTITAIYELIVTDTSNDTNFATFDFRYKKPNATESIPLIHEIKGSPNAINLASENMRFGAAVTGFGLLLKNSEYKGEVSKQMVIDLANTATTFDPNGFRKEFTELVTGWNP
ncbi:vWA domain-containing protein [Hyunsoonleella sp. 2307UL5-6]|uniref:vWA domain-containing protein n=1 Tax=Hyunsoonleella sp. 2307UL5-6 TaxID=3384768 RepID=UPI0039BD9076